MSVEFESTIKMADEGFAWCVEIRDCQSGAKATCSNLDEYEKKLEEMGEVYGGMIDNVKWICDEEVPPYILDEVRFEMVKFQEKYKEQIDNK